jgi:hypothetical protein
MVTLSVATYQLNRVTLLRNNPQNMPQFLWTPCLDLEFSCETSRRIDACVFGELLVAFDCSLSSFRVAIKIRFE